jgi:hypothetical protein
MYSRSHVSVKAEVRHGQHSTIQRSCSNNVHIICKHSSDGVSCSSAVIRRCQSTSLTPLSAFLKIKSNRSPHASIHQINKHLSNKSVPGCLTIPAKPPCPDMEPSASQQQESTSPTNGQVPRAHFNNTEPFPNLNLTSASTEIQSPSVLTQPHRHRGSSGRPPSPYPPPQKPSSEDNSSPFFSSSFTPPSRSPSPGRLLCDYDDDYEYSIASTESSQNSNPDMKAGRCWKCGESLVYIGLGPARVECVECREV